MNTDDGDRVSKILGTISSHRWQPDETSLHIVAVKALTHCHLSCRFCQ